jgi:Uncharacterized conserved protein (DUF2303)
MDENIPSNAQAIIDTVKELYVATIAETEAGNQFAIIPTGMQLQSLKKFDDERATRPERRKGIVKARDLASFCRIVNRFRHGGSAAADMPEDADAGETAIFAHDAIDKLSLTTVFDWHPPGDDPTEARYGQHRCQYDFPLSREWQEWLAISGKSFGQGDLAAFLERRIDDVVPPPLSMNLDGEVELAIKDPEIVKLVAKLDKKLATPAELVAMSRSFSVASAEKAATKIDRDTGEITISWSDEHDATVKVPNLFLISIPVLHNGEAWLCAVHLRYRKNGGTILWIVELHQPERIIEHVFKRSLDAVAKATGIVPLRAAPEA